MLDSLWSFHVRRHLDPHPYDTLLKRPFTALKAREKKAKATGGSVVSSGLWEHTRSNETGVTIHESARTDNGYTLVISAHRQGASLVDMNGEVVHEWEKTFRQIWDSPDHVDNPRAEGWIYWRRAEVLPDGDIVASVSGEGLECRLDVRRQRPPPLRRPVRRLGRRPRPRHARSDLSARRRCPPDG
ncbi:MAG: hypothetical protein ABEN55_07790 [Bradymonadaceae bacterium]